MEDLPSIQTGNDEAGINKDGIHDLPNPSMYFLFVARSGMPESNIPVPMILRRLVRFFPFAVGFLPFTVMARPI